MQNLGSVDPKYDGVNLSKGHPNRLAPNWNGYQAEPDPANPGQLRLVFNPNSYLAPQEPFMVGPPRNGLPVRRVVRRTSCTSSRRARTAATT